MEYRLLDIHMTTLQATINKNEAALHVLSWNKQLVR